MGARAHESVGPVVTGPVAVVASGAARTRIRPRIAPAHVVMLLAAALGGLGAWSALGRADAGEVVVVAAVDLVPGRIIGEDDLRTARIVADPALVAHTVAGAALGSLVGLVPRTPVRAGQLLAPDLVAPATARARTASFGVPRARALDGDLTSGDRIDVLAAGDDGRAGYVLVNAMVLAASAPDAGALGGDPDEVVITAALDAADALRLAAALRSAQLTVVRANDAPTVAAPEWWPATAGAR